MSVSNLYTKEQTPTYWQTTLFPNWVLVDYRLGQKFVDKIKRINLMNMSDNHERLFSFFLSTSNGAVLTYTYTYM